MFKRLPYILTLLIVAFAPLVEGGTTHLPVFILKLIIIALLGVYLAQGLGGGEFRLYRSPLDPAVAALLLSVAVSAAVAPYKNAALTWVQLIFYYMLFFYLARWALSTSGAAGKAVLLILCMGAFEAAFGLAQHFTAVERVTGTFFNPNMLAGYLAAPILMSLSLILFGRRPGHGKILLTCLAAICLYAVILTGSRGGVLALALGMSVVLYVRSRPLAVIPALLIAVVLVAPNPVRDRVFSHEPFAYSRAGIWASSVKRMLDHPLGVGLGNFRYTSTKYNFPVEDAIIKYGKLADSAHNEYLQAGAEMGVLGLAVLLYVVFLTARILRRALNKSGPDRAVAAGVAGGVTAIMAQAAVDSNLHEPGIVFLLILLICLAVNASEGNGVAYAALPVGKDARKRLVPLTAALILLLLIWAALPALGYYYSRMADAALRAGAPSAALGFFDKAVMVEPGNAGSRNGRAAVLYALYVRGGGSERLKDALDELKEAGRLSPRDRSYPAIMAELKYRSAAGISDPDIRKRLLISAVKDVRRARKLDPFGWDILLTQARVQLALCEQAEAVASLEELVGLEPNCLQARLLLARLYRETGHSDLSVKECRDIIGLNERFSAAAMAEQEKEFIKVDMDSVRELLKGLETG